MRLKTRQERQQEALARYAEATGQQGHPYLHANTLDRVVARDGQCLHIGLIGVGEYRPQFDGNTIDETAVREVVVPIGDDVIPKWAAIASGSWADWGTDPHGDHDENIHVVVLLTQDTTVRDVEEIRAGILRHSADARLTDMTFVDDSHEWGSNQSVILHMVNSPGPYEDEFQPYTDTTL